MKNRAKSFYNQYRNKMSKYQSMKELFTNNYQLISNVLKSFCPGRVRNIKFDRYLHQCALAMDVWDKP